MAEPQARIFAFNEVLETTFWGMLLPLYQKPFFLRTIASEMWEYFGIFSASLQVEDHMSFHNPLRIFKNHNFEQECQSVIQHIISFFLLLQP